jgi:hypothetical protein
LDESGIDVIPPWFSMLKYHQGDEQQAHWWLLFKDVASTHDHQQVNVTSNCNE